MLSPATFVCVGSKNSIAFLKNKNIICKNEDEFKKSKSRLEKELNIKVIEPSSERYCKYFT